MRKIHNPYTSLEGYYCFGCSPDNEIGLQLEFEEHGEEMISYWEPKQHLQGYKDVLHGGIQSTLMDEIGSWYIQVKLQTAGVTSRMEIRYRKPVLITKGKIKLVAKLIQQRRNLADIGVKLYSSSGELCAEATITFFIFPKEVAKEKFHYPGFESFFED